MPLIGEETMRGRATAFSVGSIAWFVISLSSCHSAGTANKRASSSVMDTRDAATANEAAGVNNSVMIVGGQGSREPFISGPGAQYLTVCDKANLVNLSNEGSDDGTTAVTDVALEGTAVHVCSYAFNNGAAAQDVQLFNAGPMAVGGGHTSCANSAAQPFMTYHLGPYESIARGAGVGVLYVAGGSGNGICVHRVQNGTAPLSVEMTYAIY